MHISQLVLKNLDTDLSQLSDLLSIAPQLVLVFGYTGHFADPRLAQSLAQTFPEAHRGIRGDE